MGVHNLGPFMGSSSAYTIFGGVGEVLGGLLLISAGRPRWAALVSLGTC